VGNFGVTEILVVLAVIVLLFGVPRRRKMKRKAVDHLRQTGEAVGSVKGEFLSGLREEASRKASIPEGVAGPRASASHQSSWWHRRLRR
jgi:Sec-independent protein translocase protein TatA